jgi:hypothetical protein
MTVWPGRTDVAHGGFGSAFLIAVLAWHMVTAFGKIEATVEDNRQSLQHQRGPTRDAR